MPLLEYTLAGKCCLLMCTKVTMGIKHTAECCVSNNTIRTGCNIATLHDCYIVFVSMHTCNASINQHLGCIAIRMAHQMAHGTRREHRSRLRFYRPQTRGVERHQRRRLNSKLYSSEKSLSCIDGYLYLRSSQRRCVHVRSAPRSNLP